MFAYPYNRTRWLDYVFTFAGLDVDGIPTYEQGLRDLRRFDEELQNIDDSIRLVDTSKSKSEDVHLEPSYTHKQVTKPIIKRSSLRLQLKKVHKVKINIPSSNRLSTDSPRSQMTTPKIKIMIRCSNCEKRRKRCERTEPGSVCNLCMKNICEIENLHRTQSDKKGVLKLLKMNALE